MSTYDLRTVRVEDTPRGEWVLPDALYLRVARGVVPRFPLDTLIEGTVHSFRTELSNQEGEGL